MNGISGSRYHFGEIACEEVTHSAGGLEPASKGRQLWPCMVAGTIDLEAEDANGDGTE